MAGTFTLTGRFKHNDGVTPWVNSTIRFTSSPYPDTADDTVYYSNDTIVTDANGAFSITLVTETSLFYSMTSDDGLFTPNPFTFAAPAAGSTRDVTDLTVFDPSTITSSIASAAAASAAAAAASAASVNREASSGVAGLDVNGLPIRSVPLWRASTVFATGQTVQAPNSGALIRRTTGGTSRASFDATEQALWFPVTGVWDVRTFDAVANGTTDNTTAINNAITACNAAGAGTVLVPGGSAAFAFGTPIVMKANVNLLVMGTLKALAANTGAGITATNVSNISITGIGTIDMNKAATTNGGVNTAQQGILVTTTSATAITDIVIRDVSVINCWQRGVQVTPAFAGSTATGVWIEGVIVTSPGNMGIYVAATGDATGAPSTSHGVTVAKCLVTSPGLDGIRAIGVSDLSVDGNTVTSTASTGHGICIGAGSGGVTTDHCTDFTVTNNKVRGFTTASTYGIVLSARCVRFSVDNNVVRGCNLNMSIDVTDPNNATAILDCDGSVTNNSLVGATALHNLYVNHATGLSVTGNTCRGALVGGSGIAVSTSTGVSVTGNVCKGNAVHGIALFGTTTGVGGHVVKGNTVTGNTTDQYNTDATPVVSVIDRDASDALVADVAVSNTTTETTLYTYTVPSNTSQVGSTYKVTVGFFVDNIATSGTLTIRLHYGTAGITVASSVIPTQAGAATNQPVFIEYLVTVRTTGATGTVVANGNLRSQFSAVDQAIMTAAQTTNTTIDKVINVTAQWATANVGNVCTLKSAVAEVVKS